MSSQSCGFGHSDGLIKVNPYVSRELYKHKKVKQQNAEWYPRGDESARSVDTHREPAPQTRKGRQKELLESEIRVLKDALDLKMKQVQAHQTRDMTRSRTMSVHEGYESTRSRYDPPDDAGLGNPRLTQAMQVSAI